MANLTLNACEASELESMIASAESSCGRSDYSYDPGFAAYSCSCTAHKKSCGWD